MQVDPNLISLTIKYLNMASVPGAEAETFIQVRSAWGNILNSLIQPSPEEETEDPVAAE